MGQTLMMLPMLGGSAGMALMYAGGRGGPLSYIAGGMFGLSGVGMLAMGTFNNSGQPSKQEMSNNRRSYLRHLSVQRQRARGVAERQRETLLYRHPDPDTLWAAAASHRLWERRRRDLDFGVVRLGLGPQDLATPLVPPQTDDVEELEPLCAASLRRFIKTYAVVPDLPVAMALRGFGRVYLTGEPARARAMTRALVAQAATFHAPDDLLIAACVGARAPGRVGVGEVAAARAAPRPPGRGWAPAAGHPDRRRAGGAVRRAAGQPARGSTRTTRPPGWPARTWWSSSTAATRPAPTT